MSESVPEQVPENVPESAEDERADALNAAISAAMAALMALLIISLTLFFRALQALFILARPTMLAGTVAALGYTSVNLFGTILVHYGGDMPAVILALAFVILTPASLLVLAGDYGIWAVCLASAGLEFLAHLGIERAPPIILALIPVMALADTTFYSLAHMEDVPECESEPKEKEGIDESKKRNECTPMDRDDELDHLHGHEKL